MREIDQIVGLRSKLGFPLLGNPHRPIPTPWNGSWSGGPLPPAGRRPPIALPLPPRFPVWRQKWESPNPVDAPEPDGLPSSSLGESFYDPAGLLRLPAPPFLPPAACCRRFPQSAPARPPHPHSRANRFSAFLAPASPPRVPLSPRARRSPELQYRNALSASPPPRQRHSRHPNRSWLTVGLPHSHGTALPPMRKRVVSPARHGLG